jgi:hypothetical protein
MTMGQQRSLTLYAAPQLLLASLFPETGQLDSFRTASTDDWGACGCPGGWWFRFGVFDLVRPDAAVSSGTGNSLCALDAAGRRSRNPQFDHSRRASVTAHCPWRYCGARGSGIHHQRACATPRTREGQYLIHGRADAGSSTFLPHVAMDIECSQFRTFARRRVRIFGRRLKACILILLLLRNNS